MATLHDVRRAARELGASYDHYFDAGIEVVRLLARTGEMWAHGWGVEIVFTIWRSMDRAGRRVELDQLVRHVRAGYKVKTDSSQGRRRPGR